MSMMNRLMSVSVGSAHKNILCFRLGFRSRVRRDTTANLGKAKQATPGHQEMTVQRIARPCCAFVRNRQCLPLPWDVATVANIVDNNAHNWMEQYGQRKEKDNYGDCESVTHPAEGAPVIVGVKAL